MTKRGDGRWAMDGCGRAVRTAVIALATATLAPACGDDGDAQSGQDSAADGTATGKTEPKEDTGQGDTAVGQDDGGGSSGAMDDAPTGDGVDSGGPTGTCQPLAVRMIVLGDSIAACEGVGGKDSADCAPKRLHDDYASTYGPTTYENLSVGGAVTRDVVNQQLPNVPTGMAGHALVVIYVGGNDLSPYLAVPDQAASDGYAMLATELTGLWAQIYTFFDDPQNFPDGVTLLMNTQYDPFDGCTTPPYNVSQLKLGLLVEYNDAMKARAQMYPWVFVADQHAPFLGHGHHAAVTTCPNYMAGYAGWMNDLIHPNELGHANLADVMAQVAATMYVDCG